MFRSTSSSQWGDLHSDAGLPSRSSHVNHASEGWSGRRGSNPRPTAWKAVTLPLSYSRLRVSRRSLTRRLSGQARHARSQFPHVAAVPFDRFGPRTLPDPCGPPPRCALRRDSLRPLRGLPSRSPRSGRRLVAREGLEPSKPLGRQIYSLLRLTASLPRQLSVCCWKRDVSGRLPTLADGAGEGI